MKRSTITAGLGALALLLSLTACSVVESSGENDADGSTAPGAADTLGADAATLLAQYKLSAPDTVEALIEQLESQPIAERPDGLLASVRVEELVLSGGDDEISVPLPDNQFHLSVAPYLTDTHECFFHSLTTCVGELSNTDLHVSVTDADSDEILFEADVTTHDNGYFDVWLPADRQIVVAITDGEHSAEAALGTGAEDPTCVTTIQLS